MGKTPSDLLLDLIGQVYDAALNETLWAGLAPDLAATFESPSCTLHLIDPRSSQVTFLGRTENFAEHVESYAAYYHSRDLWAAGALKAGLGTVCVGAELVSDEDLLRSEFYADWCRKADQRYIAGTIFPVDEALGVVAVHRPSNRSDYGEKDKHLLTAFLPHLLRALQIRQRLSNAGIERRATLDALERTGTATLVVTRSAHILYANALAERVLREGEALRAINGRLVARDRGAGERLSLAIVEAVKAADGSDGAASGILAVSRDEHLPLTLMVAPLRPAKDGFGSPIPAAIVFIRDPEQSTPSIEALRGLFGLTAAEAGVAAAIAKGRSLDAIAASHRVSLNTARTHLKNILSKTGTRRQAELVALLLRSVAAM